MTISIWHQWSGDYLNAIEEAFAEYTAMHPNVTIDTSKESAAGTGAPTGPTSPGGVTQITIQNLRVENIGVVAFYDTGYIGAESFYDGTGEWHAGAGVGLRYLTGLGPIRLDVAAPVAGSTGAGIQVYLGIGQAF